MQKRGLSTIVVTLIIILVSLVAVGIIWVVVRNVIQTGSEGIAMGQFTLDAKIMNVNLENSSNNVNLTVKRNPGEGEFTSLKFIFYDGKDSEVITEQVSLSQLEERRFNFHLNILNVSRLVSISIVPILNQNGKDTIGNVLDKYTVGNGQSSIIIPTGCTPLSGNYCSTQGYVCGSWGNGTCPGNVNCGTCGTGICNASGRCVVNVSVLCESNTYYIDFVNGSDSNNGTCSNSAWKHAPGDDNATGNALSTVLTPGKNVVFKGGVVYNGRIDVDWSGTFGNEISYISGHLLVSPWGTGRAIIDGAGISFLPGMGVISIGSSDYIIIRGLDIRNLPTDTSHYSGEIGINTGEHITIDNCLLHNGGGNGIMMYGLWTVGSRSDDIKITNNEIYQNGGHGILLLRGISNIVIENNKIHDNGWPNGTGQSDGIFGGGNGQGENTLDGVIIRNNIIYDNPGKGPCLIGGNNILIERNYFYTTTQTKIGLEIAPTGGINTNVIIKNNIINIDTFYDGTIRIRVQWDPEDGLDGLKIYNNTITRIGNYWAMDVYSGGTTEHSIRNIDIRNNVLGVRETPYNGFKFEGDVTYGLTSDYNHYFDEDNSVLFRWTNGSNINFNNWQSMGFDTFTHQQFVNPMYSNPSNILGSDGILWTADDGLIPQGGSPLCNTGENGTDIGAYEC